MIQHVALEVREDMMSAEGEFWQALGFAKVETPEALGSGFDWYERGGTQVHLMRTDEPTVPSRGHIAVVAGDFDQAIARLEAEGFEPKQARQLWGARRAKATTPSGHLVEVMEAPPVSGAER